MSLQRIAAAANPYVALMGAGFMLATLLATMSLTTFDRQWLVFLSGVLAAAVLAVVSRTANSQWVIARRTVQIHGLRDKLAAEVRRRTECEAALAHARAEAALVHESLPAMLAYVDADECVRYHNSAYARWAGLPDSSIDGRKAADILGEKTYADVDPYLKRALAGDDVRYERTQFMADGQACRLNVQYLPHYGERGSVAGVFAILTEITCGGGVRARGADCAPSPDVGARLIAALEHDEFSLFYQPIAPLGANAAGPRFREVLLRMNEEEEKLLPPGTFLPLAEELGMLHEVDRWVVRHVVEYAASGPRETIYVVNISAPTLLDAAFPAFVRDKLAASAMSGKWLCLELSEGEVLANATGYRDFVAALKVLGCLFAVRGFGGNTATLQLLRQVGVDFVKLDGGMVLNVLRTPGALGRLKAINDAVHLAGMRTVAECVESDCTRAALARIAVDFAQGFGIAKPRPMRALEEHGQPTEIRQLEAA